MDEERARREAEERRTKIKKGIELVELLKKRHQQDDQSTKLLSATDVDVLLWYVEQLRSVCRTTDRVLYNQIYEMQQLKKNVVQLY